MQCIIIFKISTVRSPNPDTNMEPLHFAQPLSFPSQYEGSSKNSIEDVRKYISKTRGLQTTKILLSFPRVHKWWCIHF